MAGLILSSLFAIARRLPARLWLILGAALVAASLYARGRAIKAEARRMAERAAEAERRAETEARARARERTYAQVANDRPRSVGDLVSGLRTRRFGARSR